MNTFRFNISSQRGSSKGYREEELEEQSERVRREQRKILDEEKKDNTR
jgi:hypothetical protein